MTYQLDTLPSGLRVASEKLPGVESVAVAVSVGVGSRYEEEKEGGISHLLEHMAFKGTSRRSARQIAEAFDNIGGQFNAYTSSEHTVYYAKVLKNELPMALDILADILQHSVFDNDELRREQGVILQEIAAHKDSPDDLIFDLFDQAAFPAQPLGRSILGTPEGVSSYTREDLINYMGKHYHPTRMVVSAAGNVAHKQLLELAETHFSQLAPGPALNPEPGNYKGGDYREESDLEQLQLAMGWRGLSVHDKDYYAIQLFSNILGGGMSSRLFQEIREKRGLAYHVSSSVTAYRDCGIFSVYSATGGEHAHELPLLIADELKKMADGVLPAELSRVKNQQKAELLMARESPGAVAGWIGKHLLIFGKYRDAQEIMQRVEAVTADDISRIARHVLATPAHTLAALGPVKGLPDYEVVSARLAA